MMQKQLQGSLQISRADEYYYSLALQIALDKIGPKKHGAVIVKGNRIISLACNVYRTHPLSHKHQKHSIHAEQRALAKACNFNGGLQGARLYSAKVYDVRSKIFSSRPCEMCMELIQLAGIITVVYEENTQLVKERI